MTKRPVDADLKFWSAVARQTAAPRSAMSEIRANFGFAVLMIAVVYSCWCLWDRFAGGFPVEIRRYFPLETEVPAGGKLYVHFDLYRRRTCEIDAEYVFIDSMNRPHRFAMPHSNANGLQGDDHYERVYDVPPDMASGPARLRLIASWSCPENLYEAVYPITKVLPDIHFNVLPAAPSP